MAEHKKMIMLIGGIMSAALCSTGFAGRTAGYETEKAASVNTVKIAECIPGMESENKVYTKNIQIIDSKIEEIYKLAGKKARRLMASIIFCEAGNQPYEGQVAVGAVIMNRVKSSVFPNTVEEVVYQSGQFVPACTGWLDEVRSTEGYTSSAMQAAEDAIAGVNPVGGCLYFDRGGSGMQIGDHYFH